MRTVFTHELVKYRKSNECAQRKVRFLIQTNECVNTVRIHFPWCFMLILYIMRSKFLFDDKLCGTDSSQKLIKDVSYINVLTVDIF